MERRTRWVFTREQLLDTPSRRGGMEPERESSYRRQAANFIRHVGQKLSLPQLWINTAVVLMQRFFMYQSFTRFDRNVLSLAVLFCVAKSFKEEDGRIHPVVFLKTAHSCLYRDAAPLDPHSPQYEKQLEDLLFYEYVLLATLAFDFDIDHAHTHILKNSHLVTATKALTKVAHDIASSSLEFTTMCLQYRPTAVACFCLQLACQWANWEIPPPKDERPWFHHVDESLTQEFINHLIAKFRHNVGGYYPRLQEKIMSIFYKDSPVTPHPSPSNSPWREVCHPENSPVLEKFPKGRHQPHPQSFHRPPALPPPQLPQKPAGSLHNNHKTLPASAEHLHHQEKFLTPGKAPQSHSNAQKTHQKPQNFSKNTGSPPGHLHHHHHRHHHLEHRKRQSPGVNYLEPPRIAQEFPQNHENSVEKILSSMSPGISVEDQPSLEVPDDLLEMAPPENFDFEHIFMNVVESLTSITNPDPPRGHKSDVEGGAHQEVPAIPSGVDSIDSGVFSQPLSQSLSQNVQRFEEIPGDESFASIFQTPGGVDAPGGDSSHLQGLERRDDVLRDDKKRRKKEKHKKERKMERRERKERRRREQERERGFVSPIKIKIPREKLGNFGGEMDVVGDVGITRKRQREEGGESQAKRFQGD
ncbi:cyclin-T1-1-like [Fopius arisanus]|uniref:Cyclin-T1-1-like n=2 Tax=Fopius arisanus TaxID=64838 RepID=A0A9R1TBM0_9HYME|nr:PREDICTED: cyclin-T1-1-like [Fopius arisanus]